MTEAVNAPVRRAPKELNTADLPVGQKPVIVFPDSGPIERGESIEPVDINALNKVYTEALAFTVT